MSFFGNNVPLDSDYTAPGTSLGGMGVSAGNTVAFSFIDGGDASTFANGQANTAVQGLIF